MKSIANLRLGKLPLLGTTGAPAEDERVLELFRNRAELKKAYSELQDEIHALKDRLKQQEGATAQVQEMLQELETRLESPDTAFPAFVFYSLKRLWNTSNQLLARFAAELQEKQRQSESRAYFVESNRRRFERRRELEAALQKARDNCEEAERHLAALEAERVRLARPWHYFKRKDLEERITVATDVVRTLRGGVEPARQEFFQFEQEAANSFPGLSVEARRTVNIATIAYAEVLYLRLAKTPLVGLAKSATLRRSCGDDYGDRAECEALIEDVGRALAILAQEATSGPEIKARIARIRGSARYRDAADCVPITESIHGPPNEIDIDAPRPRPEPAVPNVLADDTWDILKVLVH